MEKWEYKEEFIEDLKEPFIDYLNRMGQEGWELIYYDFYTNRGLGVLTALFKRKIQQG